MMVLGAVLIFMHGSAAYLGFVSWRKIELPWVRSALAICMASIWLLLLLLPQQWVSFTPGPADIDLSSTLPRLRFILDDFSQPFALAILAVLIFSLLDKRIPMPALCWILGVGATTLFCVLAGNVTTLLMGWALLEMTLLIFSFLHQKSDQQSTFLSIPFILRLVGPGLLILAGLIGGGAQELNWSLTDIPSAPFLVLLGASLFRWGIWLPIRFLVGDQQQQRGWLFTGCLPSAVSSMLLYRLAAGQQPFSLPLAGELVLGGSAVAIAGCWMMKMQTRRSWKAFFLGWILLSYLGVFLQQPEVSYRLGMVILIPGWLLFYRVQGKTAGWMRLAVLVVGFAPLPFFPSYKIAAMFPRGIAGVLAGICMGFLLTGAAWILLEDWEALKNEPEEASPRILPGLLLLLITQWIIEFPWRDVSGGNFFENWEWRFLLALIVFVPSVLLLPGKKFLAFSKSTRMDLQAGFSRAAYTVGKTLERLVLFGLGLLEGRGGLFWTLLIGFFILTLINLGGGG